MQPIERFQALMRELFQFDCQELDYGIYNILKYKRKQIEEFISTRLSRRLDEAFTQYAQADRKVLGLRSE